MPTAYQVIDGNRVNVRASFKSFGNDEYGFAVGEYARRFDLVIDPLVLVFSTYLGGYGDEFSDSIVMDNAGAVYVSGYTPSKDFPPLHVSKPRSDAFVTKLSADGRSLVYSAFFPVTNESPPPGIAVDGKGSVYMAGTTDSRSFPIKNAFQDTMKGYHDAFFLKLTPNGKGLVFSSYLGGSRYDLGNHIALDATGSFFVGGQTNSSDFPILKAYQKTLKGDVDAYVSKFSSDGKSLIYSTYVGGAIAVDGNGNAYIGGDTGSYNFPLKDAYQNVLKGSYDCFLTILAPDGKSLVLSTLLGGSYMDFCYRISLGADGTILVTGQTNSLDFPVLKPYQKSLKGGYDVFVTKLKLVSD